MIANIAAFGQVVLFGSKLLCSTCLCTTKLCSTNGILHWTIPHRNRPSCGLLRLRHPGRIPCDRWTDSSLRQQPHLLHLIDIPSGNPCIGNGAGSRHPLCGVPVFSSLYLRPSPKAPIPAPRLHHLGLDQPVSVKSPMVQSSPAKRFALLAFLVGWVYLCVPVNILTFLAGWDAHDSNEAFNNAVPLGRHRRSLTLPTTLTTLTTWTYLCAAVSWRMVAQHHL